MQVIKFFLIGLGTGGLYALTAQDIVLAYPASGMVNSAQGAFGMAAAYMFYELRDARGLPWQIALAVGILAGASLGLLRDLRRRRAGLLSGGEQQMRTMARALAGELSLGVAPIIVRRRGRIVLSGTAAALNEREIDLTSSYLSAVEP
jgi:branched-subunit amino acid ABC-type transport system permease component